MTALPTASLDLLQQRASLATQADWIAAHSRATELGRRARRAYLDRFQLRNLQRVAETATAVSAITDYVKTQIGKHPLWRRENFGLLLLEELERLRSRASDAADSPGDSYLRLCRLYIRQVGASYLHSIVVDATAPRPVPPPARPTPPARETGRPPRQRGQRNAPTPPGAAAVTATIEGPLPPIAADSAPAEELENPPAPEEFAEPQDGAQAAIEAESESDRSPTGSFASEESEGAAINSTYRNADAAEQVEETTGDADEEPPA